MRPRPAHSISAVSRLRLGPQSHMWSASSPSRKSTSPDRISRGGSLLACAGARAWVRGARRRGRHLLRGARHQEDETQRALELPPLALVVRKRQRRASEAQGCPLGSWAAHAARTASASLAAAGGSGGGGSVACGAASPTGLATGRIAAMAAAARAAASQPRRGHCRPAAAIAAVAHRTGARVAPLLLLPLRGLRLAHLEAELRWQQLRRSRVALRRAERGGGHRLREGVKRAERRGSLRGRGQRR